MSSQSADVATVLALEEPAKALLEAIKAAEPAIKRLKKANYPGTDWVYGAVGGNTDDHTDGNLTQAVGALDIFRKSAGDLGAFDYLFFVKELGMSIGKAAKLLMDEYELDEAMPRVEAMRSYAAAAGGSK
jgi:hypothetical protein